MQVEILDVKSHKDGSSGWFLNHLNGRAKISISLKRNKKVEEYAATLLHEIIHLWFSLIRPKGKILSDKKEHAFIYAVERNIKKLIKEHYLFEE